MKVLQNFAYPKKIAKPPAVVALVKVLQKLTALLLSSPSLSRVAPKTGTVRFTTLSAIPILS